MNEIERYISSIIELCPEIKREDLDLFKSNLVVKNHTKKEHLFSFNDKHEYMAFISSGLVRAYYTDRNTEEKTAWFVKENEFVSDYPCFISGEKSFYGFECLEDTVSVWLPKKAIYEGYKAFPKTEQYGRLMTEELIGQLQCRVSGFLFQSATERYVRFTEEYADLMDRISLGHLASYIGVERQTLTRIRKKLQLEDGTNVS
ncbi:Crp/Fnr family transcriptional regulator [Putridiphycobacter roseus]|uniref:Crp/Fnr family transcriptional regulator n=1 Tax=Putridiphycobacter roseus TaxID=2219161 RepID=A0A2W1NR78_9FLAO|nr:Crp/Fnr family transcriptional regulator [Putridiphycobacter roseus]PZE18112.1 Crp/Fnr family transcriptional regulator [Putridiphycobacter roseus]